jgi:hypothetical protein
MKREFAFGIYFLLIPMFTFGQKALNFDGANDVVQTNYSGILGSADRTFEAWVKVSPNAPNSNLCILDYGTNSPGSRNTFNVSGARGLSYISGGTNANGGTPANLIPANQWTHVAFVLNSGLGYFYINGILEGTGNLSNVNTNSGFENVKIGERVSGGSIPFEGSIDEVRIWNTARTQAEIQSNMNAELCSLDPDLQLYLRMNEGNAGGNNLGITSTTDDSGNMHSASINGFSLSGATSNFVTGNVLTPGFSTSNTVIDECNSYTWAPNNTTYTTSGNYSTTLAGANSNGCDSILNLDLSIFTANDITTTISACDAYTWSVNGQTYTSSTTVTESLTTTNGCAYNHTLNLSLAQTDSVATEISTCNVYTWSTTNQTYTTTGIYSETLSNQSGCDSIVTLDLTINSVDNTVTDNGDLSLTANASSGSFQWLDCNNGFAPISGATGQTYTTAVNGSFALEVSENGCSDTSDCIVIDYVNVDNAQERGLIAVYPNPTDGKLFVDFGKLDSQVQLKITDVNGRTVYTKAHQGNQVAELNLILPSGVYMLHLTSQELHKTVRFVNK